MSLCEIKINEPTKLLSFPSPSVVFSFKLSVKVNRLTMRIWIFFALLGLCLAKQEERNDRSKFRIFS